MSIRIVVDMNLSVEWIPLLEQAGWSAVHWSAVGDPRADDTTIMAWAQTHGYVVFTHDLAALVRPPWSRWVGRQRSSKMSE
jgi:predicted nuclease of predicted toxin-antitoxin system